jgi:hypothetical protein
LTQPAVPIALTVNQPPQRVSPTVTHADLADAIAGLAVQIRDVQATVSKRVPSSSLALGLRIADIADAIDENTDSSDEKRMMAIANVIAKNTENGTILSMFDLCIKVTRAQRTDEAEVMEIVCIALATPTTGRRKGGHGRTTRMAMAKRMKKRMKKMMMERRLGMVGMVGMVMHHKFESPSFLQI